MGSEYLQERFDATLAELVKRGVAPGGVAAVEWLHDTRKRSLVSATGRTACGEQADNVSVLTCYDLASLTKPLVTLLLTMNLVENGIMDLSDTLPQLLKTRYIPPDKRTIALRHLLSHSAGLAPHRPFFVELLTLNKKKRKRWLIDRIISDPLLEKPGSVHCYSDLGFILLGVILEEMTGKELDELYQQMILEPLGLNDLLWFNKSKNGVRSSEYAATEICPWTKRLLLGTVHDDNCRALGGVAGHAGLFGTVEGVLAIGRFFMETYKGRRETPLCSRKRIHEWFTPCSGTTWCMGMDSPSDQGSSSGHYFSPLSRGHLGFTGTSLWIDFERAVIVVLLTNRVHPTRDNIRIRQFRPWFHDDVMKMVMDKE